MVVLSSEQVNWIIQTIQNNYTIANKEDLKRHKNNARNRQYKVDSSIKQGICPLCGGQLVLRHGKYGSFYGCANYPKCKFTINS